MSIAEELEQRLWYLADPQVKWVPRTPNDFYEACLVLGGCALSNLTQAWLNGFCLDYDGCWAVCFNDDTCNRREQVLWMLEEAIDQARWEGV